MGLPKQSANTLRVLHIGKYFPPFAGGMETYLRDLMNAQLKQGHEPIALVHQSEISLTSQEDLYHTGEQKFHVARAAVWARLIFTPISPTFPYLLRKLIRTHKPQVLHLHLPNASAFFVLFLPSARKIPWVVHWHSDVIASRHSTGLRLLYTFYRPFETAILRRSSRIIATSPPYLMSSQPLAPYMEKCEVVPLGISPQNLSDKCIPERSASETLRILAIGRLTYYKGFEYLIRAVADNDKLELRLVGTGELESKLRKLAREKLLTRNVNFLGTLSNEELVEEYTLCDCVCLPSIERTEAFGMVLLEAMSHGKPTIATRVKGSGMSWVVKENVSGLLVPPQNTAALREALAYFCENRGSIRTLGENGRARFGCMFHIDQSAAGVDMCYRKLRLPKPE